MSVDREIYRRVIVSQRWHDLRSRLIGERGMMCERCEKTWAPGYKTSLQLHHKTYERLSHERDSDLELLCGSCHASADTVRATDAQRRATSALDSARVHGWARKKYGDDWQESYDSDSVSEEFYAWVDERSDE